MEINGRIPIIALDYNELEKRVEKELLIDYDAGKIYIVSKEDKAVIFDVTQHILDAAGEISGDNLIINIEGIGDVNLSEIVNQLYNAQIGFTDLGRAINVGSTDQYDLSSITKINNRVGVRGFDGAPNHFVPVKKDSRIEWYPCNGYSVESVIKEINIVIDTNIPYYSLNLTDFGNIGMTPSESQYNKITLHCLGNIKAYMFPINVKKSKEFYAIVHDPKAVYIVVLETFDKGVTWLADCVQYF